MRGLFNAQVSGLGVHTDKRTDNFKLQDHQT